MSDLECPYCGAENEICHDDGFGYEEDKRHEMQCHECDKNFVFATSISFNYYPSRADCLNGEPHQLAPTKTYPRRYTSMACLNCDHEEALPADHPYLKE